MTNFRPVDRATPFLLPPSVEDWLPKDHLARFVVDIVDQLDLSALTRQYRGTGSAPYHPTVMLSLLIYGYATGVYSSRRIEVATYESIAFRYLAANQQPDHDSLCAFRKRFLKEIEAMFVQVLCIARQMKLLKLGTIALDGTKIHANASRHSALSHGHAQKIEAQLEAEVKQLLARAEAADQEPLPEGLSIPKELLRRKDRLDLIRQAKAQIEAGAAERDAREKADFDAKLKAREDNTARTGKKLGGKPPEPPRSGVRPTDQINLTDADSRIMPATGKGFEQSYNAQAAVDTQKHASGGDQHRAGGHRQAAGRADARRACRLARGIGQRGTVVGRQRVLQRGQRRALRSGEDRTVAGRGARWTSPALGGSIHRAAATARACRCGGPNEAQAHNDSRA